MIRGSQDDCEPQPLQKQNSRAYFLLFTFIKAPTFSRDPEQTEISIIGVHTGHTTTTKGAASSMEKSEDKIETVLDEPVSSVGRVANTANKAVRDTAQKYLNAAGMKVNLKDVEERLRERGLLSLGIAAGAGFILGGGLGTGPVVLLFGLFGRRAARQMAMNTGRKLLQNARSRA